MAFGAQIIADSLSPDGVRLTSFLFDFPRYIQAEINTHKMLSKNSASSRAIPVKTMLKRLAEDPYMPVVWGSNKKGMQAGEELGPDEIQQCKHWWLKAMEDAMTAADEMRRIGLHKQDANRILEPWMWQTVLMTGTEWWNFFNLRNHPEAHPAFQTVAGMMQELYEELEPRQLKPGMWHLPFIDSLKDGRELPEGDLDSWAYWTKVSVGRCARTSTFTHDGIRDPAKDIWLHDRLLSNGHLSPFEHQARPAEAFKDDQTAMVRMDDIRSDVNDAGSIDQFVNPENQWHGNLRGWVQYRKTIPNESDIMGAL